MNLKWGSEEAHKFVTNVGLITTRNKQKEDNVIACEWTHNVSYAPWLIAVCVGRGKKSAENIDKSKEFIVNIASVKENKVSSVAGGSSGNEVDKIAVLKELGVKFEEGKKVKALRIVESSLIAECKLIRKISDLGTHDIFIGEVVDSSLGKTDPLIYSEGKYWLKGENIPKPNDAEMKKISDLVAKYSKS